MNNDKKQKREELAIFKNFIRVCEYDIVESSIEQQEPPKPDILCQLATGEMIEFELAQAVYKTLAQKMNDERIKDKGGFCEDDVIPKIIFNKNNKAKNHKYELTANRFELLVYLGIMPKFPYWDKMIPDFLMSRENEWVFDRIWILRDDINNPEILWSFTKPDMETNFLK